MKTKFLLFSITSLIILGACHRVPSIEKVEQATEEGVRELLMEDNNELVSYNMERYFLSEQIDDYTFRGLLKATVTSPLGEVYKAFTGTDTIRVYRTVEIKFRDKKYDSYVITIKKQED